MYLNFSRHSKSIAHNFEDHTLKICNIFFSLSIFEGIYFNKEINTLYLVVLVSVFEYTRTENSRCKRFRTPFSTPVWFILLPFFAVIGQCNYFIICKNLVLSNELIKVELPP